MTLSEARHYVQYGCNLRCRFTFSFGLPQTSRACMLGLWAVFRITYISITLTYTVCALDILLKIKHFEFVYLFIVECGVRSVPPDSVGPYIVNGDVAARGAWPWYVQVLISGGFCGGSIINERWILTAGSLYPQLQFH